MELISAANDSATPVVSATSPCVPYTPYLLPLYPVYFAHGLFKHARSYSTDASAYTITFAGAVAWIRSQAIDGALQASGAASLIAEPMPSFDDIPEIPDEDGPQNTLISEDSIEGSNKMASQDGAAVEPLEEEVKKSTVVVSEKPRRTAKGLVKQYRSGKEKARPCAMRRTGLHTISEEETLDLALASPLVRIYKPRKPKNKRRRRKASVKGDENAPVESAKENFPSIAQTLATRSASDSLPRKRLSSIQC
ncbi:hypothetical protein GY45DRAFT_1339028 [Cubamyces sp. BRFM 1775]|nr:hypothetical protein GY45DRAFT_1339028 [Cubamyces sp. BRFM 1775]